MIYTSVSTWLLILALYLSCEISISVRCNAKSLDNVNSEEVKVSFVTRIRNKRDIHTNDFHIVRVQRPARNSSFQIHLVKNERLVPPTLKIVHRDNATEEMAPGDSTFANEGNCFYSGMINSDSFQGQAALSACGENPGFHGVLLMDSGMYVLEPLSEPMGDDQANSEMTHSLTPMSSDVTSGVRKCGKQNIYAPPGKPYANSDIELNESIGPVPLSANRNYNIRGKHLKRGRTSSNNYSKPKTPFNGVYTMELAIFVDQSFMENMKKKLKTTKAIHGFIYVLTEAMALMYKDKSMQTKMEFKLVHMEFFSKTPSAIKMNHGLLTPYLKSFCKYATDHSPKDAFDHAMLLTNTDLRDENSNAAVGVAFTNGCCMDQGACSIIEASSFQAAFIMAHEVGHSLGMGHDGEENNKDCKSNEYIMSAVSGPRQTQWSSCSNKNMQEFLKMNEMSRYMNVRKDCLKSFTANSTKSYQFISGTGKLPGERFTPDQQCLVHDAKRPLAVTKDIQITFGLKGDICEQLFCTDKSKTYASFVHPALEGTDCASGKQCRNGACKTKS